MSNVPGSDLWEVSPQDQEDDCDRWWPLLSRTANKPLAKESTTLTALLLLAIVATSDRENMFPATGRVLNLVCALQQDHDGAKGDAQQRARVITRLSEALSGLRGAFD